MGSVIGQQFNSRKSAVWASNAQARKVARIHFPNMLHEDTIEVLGAKIYTTEKLDFDWSGEKTESIIKELKLISTLPCTNEIREHLAGTKVIPRISFASHINKIPKSDLKIIQDQITKLLWRNRPMWRSRH